MRYSAIINQRSTVVVVATWMFCAVTIASADTGEFDGGGGSSTGSLYAVVASLGVIGGHATAGSVINSGGEGYTAPSVVSLALTAAPVSVNQGGTSQLTGTAAMDDQTVTVLSGTDIAWNAVTYPLQSITAGGMVTAVANVYATAVGNVYGSYNGVLASTSLQVAGPYASSVIPDSWFVQYFGTAPNPKASPTADASGTGQNNLFKYIAGLDPTNPVSVFTLRIESVAEQAGHKALIFNPCWNDRTYTLLYRTNLVTGTNWTNLTTTLSDNGSERILTDTNATDNARFYRIQITYP